MVFYRKDFNGFWSFMAFSILLFCYSGISTSEELVSTIGLGVGDSKAKACEEALDKARTEAAQQAVTIVESSIGVVENSNGTASYSSTTQTTKAYAKVVSKSEKSKYDPDTGKISCEIDATFRAGFVLVNNKSSLHENDTNSESVQDFKYGEVFCSKIMGGCFREIYSAQLDMMGIQHIIEGKGMILMTQLRNVFFNKGYQRYRDKKTGRILQEELDFSTKDKFLKFIRRLYDTHESRRGSKDIVVYVRVNAYEWINGKGFREYRENPVIVSRSYDDIGIFSTTPKVSDKYIESLDKQMRETYQGLKELY